MLLPFPMNKFSTLETDTFEKFYGFLCAKMEIKYSFAEELNEKNQQSEHFDSVLGGLDVIMRL